MWIGVDIGGTKIESFLLGETDGGEYSWNGRAFGVLAKSRLPTERDQGYEHIIQQITQSIENVLSETRKQKSELNSIGLAMPGSVHPKKNIMLEGNTQALVGKDVVGHLRRALKLKCHVFLENDANCFAMAETLFGVGPEYTKSSGIPVKEQYAVGVILGTGMGGGFVMNGRTYAGAMGAATEIGHLEIHEGGRDCYCGRGGCAEQYLAGSSVERIYEEKTGESLSSREIFALAESGDIGAAEIIKQYVDDLGKTLANVNNVLNPHYFVLGGGVSLQKLIYENLEEAILKHLFVKDFIPAVFKNKLGDSCGGIGAALVSMRKSGEMSSE